MGFTETDSAAYTLFSQLADVLARYLKAKEVNQEKAAIFREIIVSKPYDISRGLKFIKSPRHTGYIEADAMQLAIRKLLGC
jgi:hypothetical protein